MPKGPNTRFTRIGTVTLKALRRFCKAQDVQQSQVVTDAVEAYLKRAGNGSRSKTKTPNPRRK